MGRQNLAYLYARVSKAPKISRSPDTKEYNYGMAYVDVVRGFRKVEDDVNYTKHDSPLIISREKEILEKMALWKENSIVFIKGVITTNSIEKTSYCPNCTNDKGESTENKVTGNIVFITPIYVRHVADYDSKEEAVEDLVKNKEISNQIYVLGTLLKDPKLVTTKKGIKFTQYPIAINRKYTIRTDDPSIRTDWPIVKSYGEQALDDRTYLRFQSDVLIDGFLQARTITRRRKCDHCGEIYDWKDHCMELIPYDVEYVSGYKTKEEAEAEYAQTVEEYKQMLYSSGYRDELDEDLKSDDTNEE